MQALGAYSDSLSSTNDEATIQAVMAYEADNRLVVNELILETLDNFGLLSVIPNFTLN